MAFDRSSGWVSSGSAVGFHARAGSGSTICPGAGGRENGKGHHQLNIQGARVITILFCAHY